MTPKRPLVWGDDTQTLREIRDGETLAGVPGAGGSGSTVADGLPAVMAGGVALKDGEVDTGDAVFLRIDAAGQLRCARASAAADGRAADAMVVGVAGERVWFCQHGLVAAYENLAPGDALFLSTTPGGVTTTPPGTAGFISQRLGTALTASVVMVERGVPRLILGG